MSQTEECATKRVFSVKIITLVCDYLIFCRFNGFLSSCRFILYFDYCSFTGVDSVSLKVTSLSYVHGFIMIKQAEIQKKNCHS